MDVSVSVLRFRLADDFDFKGGGGGMNDVKDDSDQDSSNEEGGYLDKYPNDVKVVVEALKSIELQQIILENKYQREVVRLNKKVLPVFFFVAAETADETSSVRAPSGAVLRTTKGTNHRKCETHNG
jgi:hypothetical protein